jgi:hypothetical protein
MHDTVARRRMPFQKIDNNMNTKIDLKSALCGLAVGILAMLAIGASNSSNPIGRYYIASGSGFVTVLDTTTGQVWGANLATPGWQSIHPNFWDKKAEKD